MLVLQTYILYDDKQWMFADIKAATAHRNGDPETERDILENAIQ